MTGHKRTSVAASKLSKEFIAIQPATKLLEEPKRKELIHQISGALAFDATRFDSLCMMLIQHVANHCQLLPETSNVFYHLPGGLIDQALHRTEAALTLFRHFVLKNASGPLTEIQELWMYALFSAALLQGLGKLCSDYKINLFDNQGQFLTEWHPLLESMMVSGHYYQYELLAEADITFRGRLNILLARLLMPSSGFAWIASNKDVLAVWLALLNEDARGAGTLGVLLVRAEAIALQRFLDFLFGKGHGTKGQRRLSTFMDNPHELIEDKEHQTGANFLKWLADGLASGRIVFNKVPLLMVPGGILMCAELFQWFMRDNPSYKNWQAVQKGLLSLGLHECAEHGDYLTRFEQSNNQSIQEGILLADYAVILPENLEMYHPNTGTQSSISALEVVRRVEFGDHYYKQHAKESTHTPLQQLNAQGQWHSAADTPEASAQLGAKQRG